MSILDIPVNHPCFAGHFPGQPVLPGVLLLQRVVAFAKTQLAHLGASTDTFRLLNVKFPGAVRPGDQLRLSLIEGKPEEYSFSLQVVTATDADAVLVCSGILRLV